MHKVTDIFISFILFIWDTLNWVYSTRITSDIKAFYSLKEVIIYIVVIILYLIIQILYRPTYVFSVKRHQSFLNPSKIKGSSFLTL